LKHRLHLSFETILTSTFLSAPQVVIDPMTQNSIPVHSGFRFFATQNPSATTLGRKLLPPSLTNRCVVFAVADYTDKQFVDIVNYHLRKDLQQSEAVSQAGEAIGNVRAIPEKWEDCSREKLGLRDAIKIVSRAKHVDGFEADAKSAVAQAALSYLAPMCVFDVKLRRQLANAGVHPSDPTDVKFDEKHACDGHITVPLVPSPSSVARTAQHERYSVTDTNEFARTMASMAVAAACYEPVLLCGPSSHKSLAVREFARKRGVQLAFVNLTCESDVSDLFGSIQPCSVSDALCEAMEGLRSMLYRMQLLCAKDGTQQGNGIEALLKDLQSARDEHESQAATRTKAAKEISEWHEKLSKLRQERCSSDNGLKLMSARVSRIAQQLRSTPGGGSLFVFVDGPLTRAVKLGHVVLLEGLDKPQQAVIERMNSVLESGQYRSFSLPEDQVEEGVEDADCCVELLDSFCVFATCSSTFGLHGLSSAIRSRFTLIRVPEYEKDSARSILSASIRRLYTELKENQCSKYANVILDLSKYANVILDLKRRRSLRDCLRVAKTAVAIGQIIKSEATSLRTFSEIENSGELSLALRLLGIPHEPKQSAANKCHERVIEAMRPQVSALNEGMELMERTATSDNLMVQIYACSEANEPLLLSGPVGIGKTANVLHAAELLGKKCRRLNLSRDMTMQALVGMLVPDERGGDGQPSFTWCEGAMVTAMQEGSWLVFDELNLAPTALINDLAAVFDPQEELFSARGLSSPIRKHKDFRVFATLNPSDYVRSRVGLSEHVRSLFVESVHRGNFEEQLVEQQQIFRAKSKKLMGGSQAEQEFLDKVLQVHKRVSRLHQSQKTLIGIRHLLKVLRVAAALRSKQLPFDTQLARRIVTLVYSEPADHPQLQQDIRGIIDEELPSTADGADNVLTQLRISQSVPAEHLVQLAIAIESSYTVLLCGHSANDMIGAVQELGNHRSEFGGIEVMPLMDGMEGSELLGKWAIDNKGGQKRAVFRPSQLIEAMEEGKWVVLTNTNYVPSSTLERLNSLMEDPPSLTVFETMPATIWGGTTGNAKGTEAKKQIHEGFRLILVQTDDSRTPSEAVLDRVLQIFWGDSTQTAGLTLAVAPIVPRPPSNSHVDDISAESSQELLRKDSHKIEPSRKSSRFRGRSKSSFAKMGMRSSVFQQSILMEGYLEKQSSGILMKWQSRYFELSGHYLKYYQNKETKSDETLKGAVDLREISAVTAHNEQLTIATTDGNQAIILRAASVEVASLWATEITSAKEQKTEIEQALQQDDGEV
jgi:MoxR-like ATPase